MRIAQAVLLFLAVVALNGCALFGDPLKLGAGESKAEFSTAATQTKFDEAGTAIGNEVVKGDVILYEGDMINDNFQHADVMSFRAPEETISAAFISWMASRPGGGPLSEGEANLAETFLKSMEAGMKQQNLRTRDLKATRIVDSGPAAGVALARTAATRETVARTLESVDTAVNPMAAASRLLEKSVDAYSKVQIEKTKTPAPSPTPTTVDEP